MLTKRERRRPVAEINVVPYIDVMLVLLVVFMVTAPLLTQGVNVDLPKVSAKAIDPKNQEPIIVSVDANGNYYLNIASKPEQPLSVSEISQRVAGELQNQGNTPRPVMVKGDRQVEYDKIVQIMVQLQQAGATSVGLITDPTVLSTQTTMRKKN